MFESNVFRQDTFDVKQIMDCIFVMEPMSFGPIARQLKLALHTPDVLQGQGESTLHTPDFLQG